MYRGSAKSAAIDEQILHKTVESLKSPAPTAISLAGKQERMRK